MAMVMLNVGILAIVGAFNSGALALARASRASTAAALAETQLELFRGLKYTNIVQISSEWSAAVGDSTWTADSVYQQNMASPVSPKALVPTVSSCPSTSANSCDPSFLTTGPDGKSYRVDTYLYYDTPSSNGGQVKVVTVVVRLSTDLSHSLARQTSTFDSSVGA